VTVIATWNVNSVKARLAILCDWLAEKQPDIVCLQETKTIDESFPRLEIEDLGYNIETCGQKSYNGVALLAKQPIALEQTRLPGDESDTQARYIEALIGPLRIASLYLPNGNPITSEKFPYKLGWMDRLNSHAAHLLSLEEPTILAGDYNICPTNADVYDPAAFAEDALCQSESRNRFRTLCHLGYSDALRLHNPGPQLYSYWDYQGGAWPKDHGVRIDHLMLSPQATDLLVSAKVDRDPRGKPKASDHTPVMITLRDNL